MSMQKPTTAPTDAFSVTAQGVSSSDLWQIDYQPTGISIKCAPGYEADTLKLALDAAPRIIERMDYERARQENRIEAARDTLREAVMGDDDAERDHAGDVIEDLAAWIAGAEDEPAPADPDADKAEFERAADPCGLTEAFRKAEAQAFACGTGMIRVTYSHGYGLQYEAVPVPAR
ncbi:hypothetical protein [Paracoccus sp. NSM]|uniref:hypothetical protein n=1 Tax=Paracoccus sp. NSM TaxID=3457784 RepID=UPI004036960E